MTRRCLALLLAVLMAFATPVTVFAESTTPEGEIFEPIPEEMVEEEIPVQEDPEPAEEEPAPEQEPTEEEEELPEEFDESDEMMLMAAGAVVASGYCGGEGDGKNLTWTLTDDGTLTISGEGAMADYEIGLSPWYFDRNKLTSLVLEDGITTIGDYAFYRCNGFTGNLNIPDGVTSIGDYAFYDCSGFSGSLTIPNSVTAIGESAFNLCSGFNGNLTISDEITEIGFSVFAGCSGFTGDLIIPAGVTSIGVYAFYDCDGFNGKLTIPNSVTSIDVCAFAYCDGLTGSLTIPNSVTTIGNYAFMGCENFTGTLTIGKDVASIGEEAFVGCSGVSGVHFKGNAPTVVAATADYPSFDTSVTLYYLSGKTGWSTPKWNGYNTVEHNPVIASGSCPSGSSSTVGWKLTEDGTLTISGTGGMKDFGIIPALQKSTAPWVDYCDQITKIVIGEGVTQIGGFAFMGCKNVTQFPQLPSTLRKIQSSAFQGCTGLTGDIVIPDSVTDFSAYVFSGCTGLTGNLHIGKKVKTVKAGSFSGAPFSSVTVDAANAYFSAEGKMIYNKTKTELVGCLTTQSGKVIIPDSVTYIYSNSFANCKNITEVVMPNGITRIPMQIFSGCSALESVTLSSASTIIEQLAFSGCGSLTEITIPAGVATIGADAFRGCTNLTKVYFEGNVPSSIYAANSSNPSFLSAATLYFNDGAAGWTTPTWKGYNTKVVCAEIDSGSCGASGSTLTWTLTSDGTLTISGSGAMDDYAYISKDPPWEDYLGQITAIEIGEGVTYIGNNAFRGCTAITDAVVPATVTAMGESVFQDCTALKTAKIYSQLTTLPRFTFYGCSGLELVTLPGTMTLIGQSSFYNCTSLKTIDLPAGVVTIDDGAFYGSGLTTIELPAALKTIGQIAFGNCNGLSEITIPENVTKISLKAFRDCANLTQVFFEGDAPTSIYAADHTYASFPSTVTLTYMRESSGWTTPTWKGYNTKIFSKTIASGECGANGDNLTWVLTEDGTLTISGEGAMANFVLSNGSYGTSSAPWYQYKEDITALVLEDGITTIGDYAFVGHKAIAGSLSIPTGVTYIGKHAFYNCIGLTGTLVLPEALVTIGNSAFSNCTSISGTLVIPNSVKTIGKNAFEVCTKLTGLDLGTGVVTIGDYAFYNCTKLAGSLIIPESVTTIGQLAFCHCSRFTGSLVIPESVTSLGDYAFSGCSGFTGNLTIPNSVTSIGASAFYNCTGFNGKLTLPNTITVIDEYTFYGCNFTGEITIPQSVTSIKRYAFNSCDNLTGIYFEGNAPEVVEASSSSASFPADVLLHYNYGQSGWTTPTWNGYNTVKHTECDGIGHSFTNYVSDNNATCAADGTKTAKCDRCDATDTVADVGSKKEHSFTNYVSNNDATCTADGTKTAKCDGCTATDTIADVGSKKEHSFTNYVSNNDATCTADGTKTAKCDGCTATDTIADVGSKKEHSFTNYVPNNDATCTADGTKTAKCDRCDATDTIADVGSKKEHSFTNYVSNNDATCTADGTKTAKCDGCTATDTITDVGSKKEHSFTNYVPNNDATCTADGTKTAKCDGCTATDTIADVGSKKEHSFTNYVSNNDATCTADGTKTAKCDGCTETNTVADVGSKKEHSFTNYVSNNDATCTADGTKTAKCDGCTETDTIADVGSALDHDFVEWVYGDLAEDDHWQICSRENCGAVSQPEPHDDRNADTWCDTCGFGMPVPVNSLAISHEYILLTAGEQAQLEAFADPANMTGRIGWSSSDESVFVIDENGLITGVGQGTAYAYARLIDSLGQVYEVRCRVDVTAIAAEEAVGDAHIATPTVTTNLYSTNYAKVEVIFDLHQNSALMSAGADLTDNGVTISSADFMDPVVAGLFDLRVADDRTLEVVPKVNTNDAAAVKAVKSSYKSEIRLTLSDGSKLYAVEQLSLKVDKKLPSVKASTVKLESFYRGLEAPLVFTCKNGEVVAIDAVSVPNWLEVNEEEQTLSVKDTYLGQKLSGKLGLKVTVEGFEAKIPVTVSVSAAAKAPKLKLNPTSVTMAQTGASAGAEVTLISGDSKVLFGDMNVTGVKIIVPAANSKDYKTYSAGANYAVSGYNAETGEFTLSVKSGKQAVAGKVQIAAIIGGDEAQMVKLPLTVKLHAKAAVLKLSKTSITLNTDLRDKNGYGLDPVEVPVTVTPANFDCGDLEWTVLDKSGQIANNQLSVEQTAKGIQVNATPDTAYGYTYKVNIVSKNIPGMKPITLTVKTLAIKKGAITLSLAAKGNIDTARLYAGSIVLTPKYKNFNGYGDVVNSFKVLATNSKTKVTYDHTDRFDITENVGGTYTLKVKDGKYLDASLKYAVEMTSRIGGVAVKTAKPVSLSVKQGSIKVAQDVKAINLYRNDRYSEGVVTLSIADGTVVPIAKVTMKDEAKSFFEVEDLGNGRYAIGYKDDKIAAKAKDGSVKLEVWLEGNNTAKANASVTVSVKVVAFKNK